MEFFLEWRGGCFEEENWILSLVGDIDYVLTPGIEVKTLQALHSELLKLLYRNVYKLGNTRIRVRLLSPVETIFLELVRIEDLSPLLRLIN